MSRKTLKQPEGGWKSVSLVDGFNTTAHLHGFDNLHRLVTDESREATSCLLLTVSSVTCWSGVGGGLKPV